MLYRTIYITLLVMLSCAAGHSQAGNSGAPVLSDALALAVGKQIGVEGNVFTEEQLASVTELRIDRAHRLDLTDFAHFPQLKKLELRGNFISDLSPLSTLIHLNHLDLSDNRISDLAPLNSLNALTYLNLNNNLVVDCSPLAALSKLRALRLNANAIEDLTPLAALSQLGSLHANENRITHLDGIEALGRLNDLRVNRNSIIDLAPLSGLIDLTNLDICQNQIEDLTPLMSLTALESLSTQKNPIKTLAPLAKLSSLTQLSIESSRFDGDLAPLSGLTKLTDLTVTHSHVRNLKPLTALDKLAKLDLRYNDIDMIRPLVESRAPFKAVNLEGNPLGTLARTFHLKALREKARVMIDGKLFESSMELYTGFMDIDRDHNGVLSFEEALAFVSELDLKEFDALDTNRDWVISADELAELRVIIPNTMDLVWVGGSESGMALGTKDSPFRTLGEAREAVRRGGTIVLTPGATLTGTTFSEPVTITVPAGTKKPGRIVGVEIRSETPAPNPAEKEGEGS